MTPYEKVLSARRAGDVKRCHTFHTLTNPTVGGHTYGALTLLLLLHSNPSMAMVRALTFHDFAEYYLGDMPSNAKAEHPDLGAVYENIEERHLKFWGVHVDLTDEEVQWVNGCDMLDFFLFCKDELKLGNRFIEMPFIRITSYMKAKMKEGKLPQPIADIFWEGQQ